MAGRGRRAGKGKRKGAAPPKTASGFRKLGKKPQDASELTTKHHALRAIGIRLDGIVDAQLRAVTAVEAAIGEAAPPRADRIGFETLLDAALDLVFFATTGVIGRNVATAIEQGFGASKTAAAAGKEVAKNVYKNSVRTIRSRSKVAQSEPTDDAGSNPATSAKAQFVDLQTKALHKIREQQKLELNYIADSWLDSYDLATLNAVGTELIGVDDQAFEVHAREAVRQWLNFKARWFNQNPTAKQPESELANDGDVSLQTTRFGKELLEGMIECQWGCDFRKLKLHEPKLIARGIEPSLVTYLKRSNGTLDTLRINRWYTVRGHQQGPAQYIRVLQGASGTLTNHNVNSDAQRLLRKLGGSKALVDGASDLSLGILQ